jgi:N-acetylglutamate synthase-like GNAT family acetyltransferase
MDTSSPWPIQRGDSLPETPRTVRPAGPHDLRALEALVERCSPDTLFRRFHGAVGRVVTHELARVANPSDGHRSWVVEEQGHLRGTATLAWGADGIAEAAFLVEDEWFGRGVGGALFRAVAAEARRTGTPAVVAMVQADNSRARGFLRHMAPGAQTSFVGMGELEIVLPLDERPRIRRVAPITVHSGHLDSSMTKETA